MTDREQIYKKLEHIIQRRLNLLNGDVFDLAEETKGLIDEIIDSLQEEPVSEELEKACEQLAENARKHKAETLSPFFSQTDYKQGVIDGANWQKEQMMKDAVDGELLHIAAYPNMLEVINTGTLPKGYKFSDKVKLIVIK